MASGVFTTYNVTSLQDVPQVYHVGIMRQWLQGLNIDHAKIKKETIRETVRALQEHFDNNIEILLKTNETQKVDCIPGNQERVIAWLREKDRNLRLPLLSVVFNNIDQDDSRQKYGQLLSHDKEWDPESRRAIRIISFAPKQTNVEVSLHIWSKYQDDLMQIAEQIELYFRPHLQLKTKYANNSKYFIQGTNDDSVNITDDGNNRILRRTYSLVCETYTIPQKFRITSSGEIEEYNVELHLDG